MKEIYKIFSPCLNYKKGPNDFLQEPQLPADMT